MMDSTLAQRVNRRPKWGMGLVVAAGAMLAVGSILFESASAIHDAEKDKVQRQVMASELTTTLKEAYQGREVEVASSGAGEAGELGRLVKAYFNALVADRNAYEAELAAAGVEKLLDAKTLAADPDMSRSRARLAQVRAITETYRRRPPVRIAELRAAVQASPRLSGKGKRDALTGLDKGQARGLAKVERIWALEATILDEIEAAQDELQRARGRWVLREGQFAFARDADLKAYAAHVEKIRRLAAEEEALVAEARAETSAGIERLGQGRPVMQ